MENQENVGAEGQGELFKRRRSQIPDAERVNLLQGKLYQKAKQEKGYKFYVLYDKLFLPYLLREAWRSVKKNAGAAGIDGITIEKVEASGVNEYLNALSEDLRKRTYKPQAVKRVMIPKANGGERPLGIPTVRDRIAQSACKMILEPIFEADFEENSYGFRPNRSAKDAISMIKQNLKEGKTEILDADLSKYFDTIPHDKLSIAVKERVSDPRVLKLIELWLKVPVYEDGQFKGGKKNGKGTPQGGVISPLLANIFLHLLDRIVSNTKSLFHKFEIKIVRYADDFVLMGRTIPDEVMTRLKNLLQRMGLTLNEDKTKQTDAKENSFNFLGFMIRYSKDLFNPNKKYWEIKPAKKSETKVRENIKKYLDTHGHCPAKEVASGINAITRGWMNYFDIKGVTYPTVSKKKLRYYLVNSLYRYYNRKSQRRSRLYGQQAFEVLVSTYGLIDPTKYSYLPK